MVTRKGEHPVEYRKSARGGNGTLELHHLGQQDQMFGNGRLLARVVMEPGDSIGEHTHEGEAEFFYILSGTARVLDNGTEIILQVGDTLYTGDGQSHRIEAEGNHPLEYLALIVLKNECL